MKSVFIPVVIITCAGLWQLEGARRDSLINVRRFRRAKLSSL